MKKLWIVVLVLLMGFSFAMAQEIHWADQKTVTWDAPTLLIDGTPIPSEDVLAYNTYLQNYDTDELIVVETVPTMPYTYTVPEGKFWVGVSALRYIGGVGSPFESEVTWSDFLLGYGRPPAAPVNIRIQ